PAVPKRDGRVQFDRIVRFRGQDVGRIELNRRLVVRLLGIASPTVDARLGRRLVLQQIMIDVWFRSSVRRLYGARRSAGLLEGVGDRKSDVLSVVSDDVVLEGRPLLIQIGGVLVERKTRLGAEELVEVAAMEDRAHAGRRFRSDDVKPLEFAVSNRAA